MRLPIILFFLYCFSAKAQIQQYVVDRLDIDRGLWSNGIKGLELDEKNGFLWIATEVGLARYNGQELSVFQGQEVPKTLKGRLLALSKTADSAIIGITIDGRSFSIIDNKVILNPKKISFKSAEQFFYFIKKKSIPKIKPKWFTGIQEWQLFDFNKKSYLKLYGDVFEMEKTGLKFVFKVDKKSTGIMINNRWFFIHKNFTYSEQLLTEPKSIIPNLKITGYSTAKISNFKVYQNNEDIYIVADKYLYQLLLINNKLKATLVSNQIPHDENILYIKKDNITKNFYLGTENKGVIILRPKYFEMVRNKILTNTPDRSFYSQIELGKGQVQTNSGDVLGKNNEKILNSPITTNSFSNLFLRSDSVLFYATNENIVGVDLKTNEKKINIKNPFKRILVFVEKDKVTYLIDNYGISYLNRANKIVEDFVFNNANRSYFRVFDAKVVDKTHLMLATSHGLFGYHLKNKTISKIYEDKDGANVRSIVPYKDYFLIGTYGGGILIYHKGTVRRIPSDAMNYLNFSHCFVPLSDGTTWISTNNGLFRTKTTQLIQAFLQPGFQPIYQYFGKNEGLEITELNGGCTPCALLLSNANISFPTIDGLLQVAPSAIPQVKRKIKVFLDEVYLNDSLAIGHQLQKEQLPVWTQRLTFKLAVAGFLGNSTGFIQYKLDESNNWSKLKLVNPIIEIFNPTSGEHDLFVRWQNATTGKFEQHKWHFSIHTPWFKTNIFFLLCFLFLVLLVVLIVNLRNRSLKKSSDMLALEVSAKTLQLQKLNKSLTKRNQVKDRIIAILNHDVLVPLKYMHIAATRIEKQSADKQTKLSVKQIAQTSKSLELLTSNMLNWVKYSDLEALPPFAETSLRGLIQKEIDFLLPMFPEALNISVQNLIPANLKVTTRPELLRIVAYNLLLNAFKATKNGTIMVEASYIEGVIDTKKWRLIFIDTGVGMSQNQVENLLLGKVEHNFTEGLDFTKGNGVGYHIIRDVLQLLEGELQIDSEVGRGTQCMIIFS